MDGEKQARRRVLTVVPPTIMAESESVPLKLVEVVMESEAVEMG